MNNPLPKYNPDAVLADFKMRMPALLGLVFTYARLLKKKQSKPTVTCHRRLSPLLKKKKKKNPKRK